MTTFLLPKRLIFILLIAEALHYEDPFTELKVSNQLLSYAQFYFGSQFPNGALVAQLTGKVNHRKLS